MINTVTGMAIDIDTRRPVIGNGQGGLSGPAIKPIALLKVKEVYEVAGPSGIPIIGQGGIANAARCARVHHRRGERGGIGTALFYEPLVCKAVNQGLAELPHALWPEIHQRAGRLVATGSARPRRGVLRVPSAHGV